MTQLKHKDINYTWLCLANKSTGSDYLAPEQFVNPMLVLVLALMLASLVKTRLKQPKISVYIL